jgi:cytochrome c oxidase subunit 2
VPDIRPPAARSRTRRLLVRALPLGLLAVGATGCDTAVWKRAGWPEPVTKQGPRILALWQGSMIAALCVGGLVIGLIVWSALFFRKRGDTLPRQVRYNIPIEVLYTIVPVVVIGVLFYFTAVDESYENKLTKNPDMTIGVVGFQWSWQFNYYGEDLSVTGRPGSPPELVLPVGKKIRFVETSPDVIHSFWVVPFLFKRDVIPGHPNQFELTITKQGTFKGHCAEYCGIDHDRMIFTVRAVSADEFQSWLATTKQTAQAGQNPMYTTIPTATGSAP